MTQIAAKLDAGATFAVVAERERIARDLHDGPVQLLYAAGVRFHIAGELLTSGEHAEGVELLALALRDLDAVALELRQVATGLRLELAGGVRAGLETLIGQCFGEAMLEVEVDDTAAATLTGWRGDCVLLAAREAVANALRHGRATTIRIELGHVDGDIALTVADDGVGMTVDVDDDPRCSGLRNLRERAIALGGSLTIDAAREGGVRVTLRIPT